MYLCTSTYTYARDSIPLSWTVYLLTTQTHLYYVLTNEVIYFGMKQIRGIDRIISAVECRYLRGERNDPFLNVYFRTMSFIMAPRRAAAAAAARSGAADIIFWSTRPARLSPR